MNQFITDLYVEAWIKVIYGRKADVENKKAPTNGRGSIYPGI